VWFLDLKFADECAAEPWELQIHRTGGSSGFELAHATTARAASLAPGHSCPPPTQSA
jgi:hypothetical protein